MRFGQEAQSLEVFHIFFSVEIFVIAPRRMFYSKKALTLLQTTNDLESLRKERDSSGQTSMELYINTQYYSGGFGHAEREVTVS